MSGKGTSGKGKPRRSAGFAQAGGLVQPQIRQASESRGFAVSRLLTHWTEVVGEDIAAMCRPVRVGYGRKGGLGATLTVLVRGAAAPLVQAQLPRIRERVNACYGYNAVARIAVTQTSATGFADGQTPFSGPQKKAADRVAPLEPRDERVGADAAQTISDPDLRAALAGLGARVHARRNSQGD